MGLETDIVDVIELVSDAERKDGRSYHLKRKK